MVATDNSIKQSKCLITLYISTLGNNKLLPLGAVDDLMHYCMRPVASCNSAPGRSRYRGVASCNSASGRSRYRGVTV